MSEETDPAAPTPGAVAPADPAPVTLMQVALAAGVSLATASRALNGSTRKVNAAMKSRVEEVAASLNYSANAQAQAVARGTTNSVALVLGDIADPYFSSIAAGVIAEADSRGLIVTMATTASNSAKELSTVTAIRGQRPRALILASSRSSNSDAEVSIANELKSIKAQGTSIALVGLTTDATAGFASVNILNREAASDLARAMIDLGYRDFAVMSGPDDLVTSQQRVLGFREGLRSGGIELDESRIFGSTFTRDGGFAAMNRIIPSRSGRLCVLAATDVMAVGAMGALREAGLEPGKDVALTGFDDIPTLRDVHPGLTTVALPLAEIGVLALRAALNDDPKATPPVVRGVITLRPSTPRV